MPTFGRVKETKFFLDSISDSIKNEYKIILIDDHPDKLTLSSIPQSTNIKILSTEKELWWVGSINLGIQYLLNEQNLTDSDIVIFANNDIKIDKNCFDSMVNELRNNKDQIIHPRTLNQSGQEVSSGAKIICFFPYITKHPKQFKKEKEIIHMGTARFLMLHGHILKKIGCINKNLVQYGGDNDFTLSARRFHNIKTYILRDAICRLDDTFTGIKNQNIKNIKELFKSFYSIKSPNNIKYRYILFKKFFGKIGAFLITTSMLINTIVKFVIKSR